MHKPGFGKMRKRRTGIWTMSQQTGTGSVQDAPGDDDDDDDEDDDDDDDDDGDKGKRENKEGEPDEKQQLKDEAIQNRLRYRKEKEARKELERRLAEVENKDKPEQDRMKQENETLKDRVSQVTTQRDDLLVKLEVAQLLPDFNFKQGKLKSVLRALDRSEVEIDEDGEITGVKEALTVLAREEPEWLAGKANGQSANDDGDDDDKSDLPGTGSSHKRRKKTSAPADDELRKKYPALGGA